MSEYACTQKRVWKKLVHKNENVQKEGRDEGRKYFLTITYGKLSDWFFFLEKQKKSRQRIRV